MIRWRDWVPGLAAIALIALFLKLPEVPDIFGLFSCKKCVSADPYLTFIAAGYFALLFSASMLFPFFPSPHFARGGLIGATLLAITFTYLALPNWCGACIIAHVCNILIWLIWFLSPVAGRVEKIKERLCILFFAPLSIIALFSCLNLTFMVYNFKALHIASLQPGDPTPQFSALTVSGALATGNTKMILNFITPDCPFCKEQLPIVAKHSASSRVINITPSLSTELMQSYPTWDWIHDKEGHLRRLFKIEGYPTLVVLGEDSKIQQIIPGVSEQLQKIAF